MKKPKKISCKTNERRFDSHNLWKDSNYRILLEFGINFAYSINHAVPVKLFVSPVNYMFRIIKVALILLLVLGGVYVYRYISTDGFLYPNDSQKFYLMPKNTNILLFADRNRPKRHSGLESTNDVLNRHIEISGLNLSADAIDTGIIVKIPHPYLDMEYNYESLIGEAYELRNLIVNKDNSIACFYQGSGRLFIRIKFDKRMISIIKKDFGAWDTHAYLTDVNSNGTQILTNEGTLIDTTRKEIKYHFVTIRLDSQGSVFINDDLIISQDRYWLMTFKILHKNAIKEKIKYRTIRVDFKYFPNSERWLKPLAVSYDEQSVNFLSSSNHPGNINPSIMLQELNLNTYEINPIIDLGDNIYNFLPGNITMMAQYSLQNNNIIALMTNDSIIIIDAKKKKIIKSIPNTGGKVLKSMRWSPDGKMLGFLKRGKYEGYPAAKVITPSSLWIYDLEKDQLIKIAEDPDYFDFLWVNR